MRFPSNLITFKEIVMHTTFGTVALTVLLSLVTSASALAADKIEINAAAGNQGGVFYVGMGAVGNAIMKDNPDIDYSMFPSAGLTNVIRVQNNQSQIGVIQSNNGYMAVKGIAPFKKPQTNIAGLVNMNSRAHTHIVVSEADARRDIRGQILRYLSSWRVAIYATVLHFLKDGQKTKTASGIVHRLFFFTPTDNLRRSIY